MSKLYDHQKKIVAEDKQITGLWLGTGAGKTRTALMLAEGQTLVICPKTQKEDRNWQRELENMVKDGLEPRLKGLVVMSKEEFRRDASDLSAFSTVIVDEAHTCLGVTPNVRYVKRQAIPKTSQLFEALYNYLQRTNPKRLYLCSATIMKSPFTVWAAGVLLGKWPIQ